MGVLLLLGFVVGVMQLTQVGRTEMELRDMRSRIVLASDEVSRMFSRRPAGAKSNYTSTIVSSSAFSNETFRNFEFHFPNAWTTTYRFRITNLPAGFCNKLVRRADALGPRYDLNGSINQSRCHENPNSIDLVFRFR